ncbi:transmembrane amino acid transporter [Podospora didyma]|uniref:Transmembrane amino acid transporter n=1 Tax=Podospora didyma TaxID=330526 RepID=A0AAE0K297_9PEZI|nr:transmembrane amino acid transporter [Podospora didyma]
MIAGDVVGDVRRASLHVARQSQALGAAQSHDPSVTFEEYVYYADITRKEEEVANDLYLASRGPSTLKNLIKGNKTAPPPTTAGDAAASEKSGSEKQTVEGIITGVSPDEWKQANRAMRTAGWGGVFYLITTDILGPYSAPWAFAQMGYGPGVALYTVFGVMSYYSGWLLWKAFMGLDSDRHPLRGYGDLYYRVFGPLSCHLVNFAQGVQLLLFVSVLILVVGQSVSQISQGPLHDPGLCFVVCLVIVTVIGFFLGQIRTLQRFAWLATSAVFLNLVILLITMVVISLTPPNFNATEASFGPDFGPGEVKTFAGTPPEGMASGGSGFVGSLNGLNQAVYSYGGSMIFAAFMAEMRHPHDFWKALLIAEVFIYVVYMFFGIFVYSYQGQYTYNPANQGISLYTWQTATNIIGIVTSMICTTLYGNIGMKVLYVEVLQPVFNAPPLTVTRGKYLWAAMIPIYWSVAFVIGAGVPQLSYISGFIGALFILSFTYTLPALLALGFYIKKDAMTEGEKFDPATGKYTFIDTGIKRFMRGYMKRPAMNTFNIIYLLGGLATTGLGMYTSIEGLIAAFGGKSAATSFGCASPV